MRRKSPTARAATRIRFRSIVTTMLLMALTVLIVRDILVKRWSSSQTNNPDVTRRLP